MKGKSESIELCFEGDGQREQHNGKGGKRKERSREEKRGVEKRRESGFQDGFGGGELQVGLNSGGETGDTGLDDLREGDDSSSVGHRVFEGFEELIEMFLQFLVHEDVKSPQRILVVQIIKQHNTILEERLTLLGPTFRLFSL